MNAPDELEAAFRRWVGKVVPVLAGDGAVAIDGRSIRRSVSKRNMDTGPLHLVSTFAAGMGAEQGRR